VAKHNLLGAEGERIAKQFLLGLGWICVAENWRFQKAEIDLIMLQGKTLVFVEVKTRAYKPGDINQPIVSERKEQFLAEASSVYIDQHKHESDFRFDFVAVQIRDKGLPIIQHYQDFFFPFE
jgi:putative endonuclease